MQAITLSQLTLVQKEKASMDITLNHVRCSAYFSLPIRTITLRRCTCTRTRCYHPFSMLNPPMAVDGSTSSSDLVDSESQQVSVDQTGWYCDIEFVTALLA